jgi:pilus assembly protein Flp/PilA
MLYPVSTFSLKSWISQKKGQGLVEYALILVLIAIVVVVILRTLGITLNDVFTTISTEIENA